MLQVPTSIELKLQKELEKRKLDFKYQYRVFGGFIVDFAFPEFKLAVECDGDYWHANPNKYSSEKMNQIQKKNTSVDKKRERIIQVSGWKILRFWESEINTNIQEVVNKIEKHLND